MHAHTRTLMHSSWLVSRPDGQGRICRRKPRGVRLVARRFITTKEVFANFDLFLVICGSIEVTVRGGVTGPTAMRFFFSLLRRLGRFLPDIQPVELSPARSAALRSHGGQERGGAGRREGRTVRKKRGKKKNSPRFSSLSLSLSRTNTHDMDI